MVDRSSESGRLEFREYRIFDMKNVAKVQFAFARDRGSLYMADMDFKGKIIPNQSTGFYASDDQISDYESLGNKRAAS